LPSRRAEPCGTVVRYEPVTAVVPQQDVLALGGDEQVGMAVEVQVGGHTPVAADLESGTVLVGDIAEPAPVVAEQPG
jgi:hypothetical protein